MTETVITPDQNEPRRREQYIPPLLVFPLVAYNLIVFTLFRGNPVNWGAGMFAIPMPSGMPWAITAGDLLLVVGIVLLFIEVLKSTNTAHIPLIEHVLSLAVLVLFLVEFLFVGAAASSVFFLLTVMSLIDVVAGFTVSFTRRRRRG